MPVAKSEKVERLQGVRGYDTEPLRQMLCRLGIAPELDKRNTELGRGMRKTRWVERTNAFLLSFDRLRRRMGRLAECLNAFLAIAYRFIWMRFVN